MNRKNTLISEKDDQIIIDYFLLNQIFKDIIVLYHQLTESDVIDCDLKYGDLNYCDFLSYREKLESVPNGHELIMDWYYHADLIYQGCLIMILSMCLERLDDAGCSLHG